MSKKSYDARKQGIPALTVKNPRARQIILPPPGHCKVEGQPANELVEFMVASAVIIAAFALCVHLLVYLF
jgi:hypothetical protein